MKYIIFRGNAGLCSHGDVVFATFKRDTGFATLMDYDHVAICGASSAIEIRAVAQSLPVYEAVDVPQLSEWPGEYEVHFLCTMYKDGRPLTSDVRNKIIETAQRIARRSQHLINGHGGRIRPHCGWSLRNYKYVRPNPNNVDEADELHFTCAGLVEYCYEIADCDIVNDPPCPEDHKRKIRNCPYSTVPLVRDEHEGNYIHRLFPGYQCKAFTDDTYPLDLAEVESPETFQRCR